MKVLTRSICMSNTSFHLPLTILIVITLLLVTDTLAFAETVGMDAVPSPTQVLRASPTPTPSTVSTVTPAPIPTLTNTPMPIPTPTSTPIPMTQTSTLYDDFNSTALDDSKWVLPTNKNLIYQRDGVLNLTNTQPAEETVSERLRAIGANRPMREVSFTINLKSYQGNISGAAGIALCLANGKRLRMDVGPGPNNGTGVEFSIYRNPPCIARDYSEEEHPVNEYFQPYVPTPIRVVWTGKELQFYINSNLKLTEPADSSPITEFLFYMYADPGSVYHVTVDDVHVLYVD